MSRDQVEIIQASGAHTYCRICDGSASAFAIIGVNTTNETFTIDGNYTGTFVAGKAFVVSGSTGNNGNWVTTSSSIVGGDTVILVTGNITNAVADGIITAVDIFTNLDAASVDYDNQATGYVLWGDQTDFLHVGFTTANNAYLGFKKAIAGVGYGTFSFRHGITGGPYDIHAISQIGQTIYIDGDHHLDFITNTSFTVTGATTPANNTIYISTTNSVYNGGSGHTEIFVGSQAPADQVGAAGTVGTIFKPFTPIYLGQANFTKDGYVAWAIPGTWVSTTVNAQAAFWIQISQDDPTVGTPAQMYHLMPNLTINPHMRIEYEPVDPDSRIIHDTVGDVHTGDIQRDIPRKAWIETTGIVLESWADYLLLAYWHDYQKNGTTEKLLWVNDLARSASPDFTVDSYYRDFIGKLSRYPQRVYSVLKNDGNESVFEFKIQSINSIPSILGLTK